MISDAEIIALEAEAMKWLQGINGNITVSTRSIMGLISEVRRLREQLKPDCVNGCIFKLARKIAEEGK